MQLYSEDAYFLMKTDEYRQSESIEPKVCSYIDQNIPVQMLTLRI